MMDSVKLKNELLDFRGSLVFYQYEVLQVRFIYTEGIRFLCDHAECYWLMDLVASWQRDIPDDKKVFQVWELKKLTDNEWVVTCTDGNDNELCRQELEYSDFPLSTITIWLVDDVLMLPGEH